MAILGEKGVRRVKMGDGECPAVVMFERIANDDTASCGASATLSDDCHPPSLSPLFHPFVENCDTFFRASFAHA